MKINKVLFILLMSISLSVSSEVVLKPFVEGSFSQILEEKKDKIFALVFWSIDCPPCYKELDMLANFSHKYNSTNIILVSTDIEASEKEVKVVLQKYKLDNIESWIYRGESEEQLRFEIDRTWYGELPRSYFFQAEKKIQVVSGVLAEEKLIHFIKN